MGEYFGPNAANEVIYMDMYGKELLLHIDFETQYFLNQHGDVLITTEYGKTTLTIDGKSKSRKTLSVSAVLNVDITGFCYGIVYFYGLEPADK